MTPLQQVEEAIAEHGRPNWVAYVPQNIRNQVHTSDLMPLLANAKWSTEALARANQYEAISRWCSENLFAEVTVADLATLSGLSAVSVRKFITDNPGLLRKIGRGLWEVRDPQEDRR